MAKSDIEKRFYCDLVDAVAHDCALPAVGDCLLFYITGRITEIEKVSVLKKKAAKLCGT